MPSKPSGFVWTEIKPKFLADVAKVKESRTERMIDSSRSFKSHGELAYWPYLDVTKYLKNNSKLIQIQGSSFGFARFEHKFVYTLGVLAYTQSDTSQCGFRPQQTLKFKCI